MHRKLFPGALALAVLFLCDTGAAGAVTPRLVKDVNPVASNPGSALRFLTVLNNGIGFFLADDGIAGYELWRSDGTEAGTWRLLDTCDFCSSHTASAKVFANAGDRLFFLALNEEREHEMDLWVTDGSEGDTFLLSDKLSIPDQDPLWMASRRLLFFSADDGEHGLQLWRSDGTAAGTWRVTDQNRRQRNFGLFDLVELNGRVFFPVDDGVNGPALWASDGTPAGTRMVRDPWRGRQDHVGPFYLGVVGQRLLFFAEGPGFGLELWASDGTTRGTVGRLPLADRRDGARHGPARLLRAGIQRFHSMLLPGVLLFQGHDREHGAELWRSDGTRPGTRLLKDVNSTDVGGSNPRQITRNGNRIAFMATAPDETGEIRDGWWRSDGTEAGTVRFGVLPDQIPGEDPDNSKAAVLGEHLFYMASGSAESSGLLLQSDGTTEGAKPIQGPDGPIGFDARHLTAFDGRVYFLWRDGIWSTDGGAAVQVPGVFKPGELTVAGPRLFFRATDPVHGTELWALE